MITYLIFGSQGSGKSTLAPYIANILQVSYLATGQMFREEMASGTALGKVVRERMNQGILIDDTTTWEMLHPYLQSDQGVLLDGFPRNLTQVKFLEENGFKIDRIFLINLEESTAISRLLSRKRADDTPDAIKQRLDLYKEQTKPVLDYYREKGVDIMEIDNTPPVEDVKRTINDNLKK